MTKRGSTRRLEGLIWCKLRQEKHWRTIHLKLGRAYRLGNYQARNRPSIMNDFRLMIIFLNREVNWSGAE